MQVKLFDAMFDDVMFNVKNNELPIYALTPDAGVAIHNVPEVSLSRPNKVLSGKVEFQMLNVTQPLELKSVSPPLMVPTASELSMVSICNDAMLLEPSSELLMS